MIENPQLETALFLRRLQWAIVALGVLWLIWLLAPVLTPFAISLFLGWMGDPLVDRLEARGLSRNAGVIVVFSVMVILVVGISLTLVPIIEDQILTLVQQTPRYRDWMLNVAIPTVESRIGVRLTDYLDLPHIMELLRSNWERAGGMASKVLAYVSRSGFALFGWMANIVLIPVITFFFLRDWDLIVSRVTSMIPRAHVATVTQLASESSNVLGGFLRGQFLVMVALGAMYGVGLWAVGLDLGILIGLVAGLLTFVPYLGPAGGILMGVLAALMQYGDIEHVAMVLAVFGIGQLIESYVLTPKLVGNRIGLHPVAVIFAVLAGGQLFGFLGMLLGLPMAAVVNVLLRYAHQRYTASQLYSGGHPAVMMDPYPEKITVSQTSASDDKLPNA